MPPFKDILDLDFIKKYSVDDTVAEVGLQKKETSHLWEGQPSQNFRIWNSDTFTDILIGTAVILGIIGALWFLALLLVFLFGLPSIIPGTNLVQKSIVVWFFMSLATIIFVVYVDLIDYNFRKDSKYYVADNGIGFLLGYKIKKHYLIGWSDIKELVFSKEESRLYVIHKPLASGKIQTLSPNDGETRKLNYPFLETFGEEETQDLLDVVQKVMKVKFI